MARLGNPNRVKKAQTEGETTPAEVQTNNEEQVDLKVILAKLKQQEAEIAKLKAPKENTFIDAKKKYTGPRKFRYSMWDGIPVVSWKSVRKNPNQDLVYKNSSGQFESNHYLKLQMADGTDREIEVNEFGKNRQKSDLIEITDKYIWTNENGVKTYVFKDTPYGDLEILQPYIN